MNAEAYIADLTGAAAGARSLTPDDLAELMGAVNEVTTRLHESHERLRNEVTRLNEELRQANERLERSRRLAALGEMAAGIAHEVRNPLGSIGLYARMLCEDLADRPEQREVARRIRDAVRGLDAVVHDVLSFAREVRIRPRDVEAGELVQRALESCVREARGDAADPMSGSASVRVAVELPDALCLCCDADLARQALVNVVRNAIEAMNETGRPGVLRVVGERRQGKDGAQVVFRVSDTGPGVSAEVVERMFNPFFTTRETGTGLGLAIVHRILDAHGGAVSVENNTGGPGATVELVFPREPRGDGRGSEATSSEKAA